MWCGRFFLFLFFVTIEVGCLTFVGHYLGSSDCSPALMLRILHADMGVLHVRLCLKLLGSICDGCNKLLVRL